jgi:hypothetical protein
VRARLQLAEGLIEAERRFLSAQALGIYEGTYLGDYGVKMRQMIEGEYRLLEDRRSAARKQNVTTALAALALAGSIYGATASGAAGAVALESFSGVLVLGSIWAMSSTLETRAESAQMSEHFMALIAPALERQISVQMEWMESKERITAIGFAEFRNKTLTLYQARIRSLESQFADDCVFLNPGFTVSGRWYGGCGEGRAEGRGYGVIVDEVGNSVEYLGTARDGLADGTGGLIARYRNQPGAYYFEGTFSRGLPDGAMLVEEPGRKPAPDSGPARMSATAWQRRRAAGLLNDGNDYAQVRSRSIPMLIPKVATDADPGTGGRSRVAGGGQLRIPGAEPSRRTVPPAEPAVAGGQRRRAGTAGAAGAVRGAPARARWDGTATGRLCRAAGAHRRRGDPAGRGRADVPLRARQQRGNPVPHDADRPRAPDPHQHGRRQRDCGRRHHHPQFDRGQP